ncbi:MAG: hypothetical protein V8Q75_05970 [Bacilli bacterium]
MFEKYKCGQPIAIRILENIINSGNYSHAYLFETNGNSEVLAIAKSFAKNIFCPNKDCYDCNLCARIDDNNFLDLKIINSDGLIIKKSQMDDLQKEFSTKPIEASKKIYIINGADKLNNSAANSILKFLEEPADDIIAILIADNRYNLLPTIVSRCQIISFYRVTNSNSTEDKYSLLADSLFSSSDDKNNFLGNNSQLKIIDSALDFARYTIDKKEELFYYAPKIYNDVVKDKNDAIIYFESLMFIYKDVINLMLNRNINFYNSEIDLLKSIAEKYDLKKLCEIINMLINLRDNIYYNINLNLLLDKLMIFFKEV